MNRSFQLNYQKLIFDRYIMQNSNIKKSERINVVKHIKYEPYKSMRQLISYPVDFKVVTPLNIKKLFYKLCIKNDISITIQNGKSKYTFDSKKNIFYNGVTLIPVHNSINRIFTIFREYEKYQIYLDDIQLMILNDYDNIIVNYDKQQYKLSIVYPLGIKKFDDNNYINLNKLLYDSANFQESNQYIISHIDPIDNMRYDIFDEFIMNSKFDYMYVEQGREYNFNLGYCRNLYKYLSLSDFIIYTDIDIPVPNYIYDELLVTLKDYDVVSPYDNNIIYTINEQKEDWIENWDLTDTNYKIFSSKLEKKMNKNLFTISGGIVAFNRKVLEKLGGYTEINMYGFEDRFMDVHILNDNTIKIKILNNKLFHLYHTSAHKSLNNDMFNMTMKYDDLYYKCYYMGKEVNNVHELCNHETKYLDKLTEQKRRENGKLKIFCNNMYKNTPTLKKDIE